jgi:hypothetical protein
MPQQPNDQSLEKIKNQNLETDCRIKSINNKKTKQTNLVDCNSNNKQLNKTLLKETHEAAAATASSDFVSRWRNTHYQLSYKWKSHEACDSSKLLLSESQIRAIEKLKDGRFLLKSRTTQQ